MRISKKISFEKVKKLERFLLLNKKIEKSIEKKPEGPISKLEDISKLNYYLVIDCKDVSEDFNFNKSNNSNHILFSDEDTNKKFIKFLNKKNLQPSYFKKLGLFYDLSGCYLVATTNKDKNKVSIYNSITNVSCKIDIDNLPKDFRKMCNEYENSSLANNIRKNPYISDILDVTIEERDKIIESIVSSIVFKDVPNQKSFPEYSISENYDTDFFGGFNLEFVIENKIEDIYDIPFLSEVMHNAIDEDNFELCAKIRDRISYLKGKR
jgi:hypothetical protein